MQSPHRGGAQVSNNFARYDGDGRRLFSDMGVQNVGSIWEVNRALPVVLYEDTPQGHVFYLYGLSLIARVLVDPGQTVDNHFREATLYFHSDGVGSVRAITNQRGHIQAAYDYTAFGESRRECLRLTTGPSCAATVTAGNAARTNTIKFAGAAADGQTGLSYHRARYYDPSTGRFTQTDPLGSAGGNGGAGYAYAGNNPQTYGDPTGAYLETAADVAFVGYDLYSLWRDGRENLGANLFALALDVAGLAAPIATGLGPAYRVGRASERARSYSVAFEMILDVADFGRSDTVHTTRASAALQEALHSDTAFRLRMSEVIPDIVGAAASRQPPAGWTWHHHAKREGVMQLVPVSQHKDRRLQRILHPGGRGGYENWAIPNGAPQRTR